MLRSAASRKQCLTAHDSHSSLSLVRIDAKQEVNTLLQFMLVIAGAPRKFALPMCSHLVSDANAEPHNYARLVFEGSVTPSFQTKQLSSGLLIDGDICPRLVAKDCIICPPAISTATLLRTETVEAVVRTDHPAPSCMHPGACSLDQSEETV